MVGCSMSFRPFGGFTRAFFVKHYVFEDKQKMLDFVKKIPKYKRRYPFEVTFYVIPEEYVF